MNIYYIFLEGEPMPDNEERKTVAGAFMNCWVKSNDADAAKHTAMQYIKGQGWDVISIEEIRVVERSHYINEPESLECFDEAMDIGIGAVFYTWPNEDSVKK